MPLACLPSQLPLVVSELRPQLAAYHSPPLSDHIFRNWSPLIYSLAAATPTHRLYKLLGTKRIIRPNSRSNLSSGEECKVWNYSLNILQSFGRPEMVKHTCPLKVHSPGILYYFLYRGKVSTVVSVSHSRSFDIIKKTTHIVSSFKKTRILMRYCMKNF